MPGAKTIVALVARQIDALGQAADTAISISTSGNSAMVLYGIAAAKSKALSRVGWTAETGGKMEGAVEARSESQARIHRASRKLTS